jgi:hypothetical protein
MWWFMPVIPAFSRQDNCKFEASLDYIASPCLQSQNKAKTKNMTSTIKIIKIKMAEIISNFLV